MPAALGMAKTTDRVSKSSRKPAASPPSPLKPAAGRIPACDRCRNFKKKCSRTLPACSLCLSACQPCSFSTLTADNAQADHLRARVEWLTAYINEQLPRESGGIEALETGADLATQRITDPSSTISVAANPAIDTITTPAGSEQNSLEIQLSPNSQIATHGSTRGVVAHSDGDSVSAHHQGVTAESANGYYADGSETIVSPGVVASIRLPEDAAARRFVLAYFRHVHKAYPFMDKERVMSQLETFGDFTIRRGDPSSITLYLIMAIGCTTLQRAGQIPMDTVSKFQVGYPDILHDSITRRGVEWVQVLVLLALYSLFDPAGPSTWSIIGIISRQALQFGLTQQQASDGSLPAQSVELRRRLFWSIYVLDRMVSISVGMPPSLTDENMSVPLPSLSINEFTSADRMAIANHLQTSRHVIQLRQIEDRILQQVHLRKRSDTIKLTIMDRRAVVNEIRSEIEDWYSNGCLLSPFEPDNLPIHTSMAWLSARYYHLLMSLYYPSQFNQSSSTATIATVGEVCVFAQKYMQANSTLLQQSQLPLNSVTLCRMFPIAIVLIREFLSSVGKDTVFTAREELVILAKILEAFPLTWDHSHQFAALIRQLLLLTNGQSTNFFPSTLLFQSNAPAIIKDTPNAPLSGTSRESMLNITRSLLAEILALMKVVLGSINCYQYFVDDTRNFDPGMDSSARHFGFQPFPNQGMPPGPNPGDGRDDAMWTQGWIDMGFL
jgi:hypothetical protein